jgi:hypothetical protein
MKLEKYEKKGWYGIEKKKCLGIVIRATAKVAFFGETERREKWIKI